MQKLLEINHEIGNLSEWDTVAGSGTAISQDASMFLPRSSFGVAFDISANGNTVLSNFIHNTNVLRVRFYFNPNDIVLASGDEFDLVNINYSGGIIAGLEFDRVGGFRRYKTIIINDADSRTLAIGTDQGATPPLVLAEILIKRATNGTGANDGSIEFFIDRAISGGAQTSIDLFDHWPATSITFGSIVGVDAGTSGTIYLDNIFVSDGEEEIGPARDPRTRHYRRARYE